ncbi:MAG: hypothetical protein F6J93_15915 [Oscillatoria sp. SIO1A7]|nr:hypothetical protein [Oscillatoria sp. SIO1A7]
MKLLVAVMLTTITTLSLPLPAKAEVAEIRDPSWQEVPGTFISSERQYADFAYVDTNGVIRNGDIVTYDVVNPDLSYSRAETNCRTNQFRATRQGYFESRTRVNYFGGSGPWTTATQPYHRALSRFVCNL